MNNHYQGDDVPGWDTPTQPLGVDIDAVHRRPHVTTWLDVLMHPYTAIVVAIILALVAILVWPPSAHAQTWSYADGAPRPSSPPDNGGGRPAHMLLSAFIGAGAQLVTERPWLAGGLCLGVGVLKEWSDYRKGQTGYQHGLFSRQDLAADAVGCAVGVLGVRWLRAGFGPRAGYLGMEVPL